MNENAIDLIRAQDEIRAHSYLFRLWPKQWATYEKAHEWKLTKLTKADRDQIPRGSGVYTLITVPDVANHPACSYVMYVGQTVSLWRRFGEYLNKERRSDGRPKVFRYLNMYSDHVWFSYTVVDDMMLDKVEDGLRSAYIPPLNDEFKGELNAVVGGAF